MNALDTRFGFGTYQLVITPVVLLRVEGVVASDLSARVIEMKYSNKIKGGKKKRRLVESCELTISDPQHVFTYDKRFDADSLWELRWGYPRDLSDVYQFRLKYYEPLFDQDASHAKKLVLMGLGHALTSSRVPRNWGRTSTSVIAQRIAQRHGLKAVIDESADQTDTPYVQPVGVSDYQYLADLANDIDFEFFVQNDVLYYRSRETAYAANPRSRFIYGAPGTLLKSFKPTVKATSAVNVTARAASTKDGKAVQPTVDHNNVGGTHLGKNLLKRSGSALMAKPSPASKVQSGDEALARIDQLKRDHDVSGSTKRLKQTAIDVETGAVRVEYVNAPADSSSANLKTAETNKQKVAKMAKAVKRDFLDASVEATADFIGTPIIRSHATFTFILPDRRLSGLWYVKEDTHTINASGYSVSCKLHRGAYDDVGKGNAKKNANRTTADQNKKPQDQPPKKVIRIDAETGKVLDVIPGTSPNKLAGAGSGLHGPIKPRWR